MKVRGPVLTLVAVAGVAAGLLVVNQSQVPAPTAKQAQASATPADAATKGSPAPPTSRPPPPQSAFPQEAVYSGWSADQTIAVAIAVRRGQAAAYLCDGASVEWWLEGSVRGSEVTLSGKNGARLGGTLTDGVVAGTIRAGGRKWSFTAPVAKPPAGLYSGESTVNGRASRIGWIRLQDGTVVGTRNVAGEVSPAPELDLQSGGTTVGGRFVPAQRVAGSTNVVGNR